MRIYNKFKGNGETAKIELCQNVSILKSPNFDVSSIKCFKEVNN